MQQMQAEDKPVNAMNEEEPEEIIVMNQLQWAQKERVEKYCKEKGGKMESHCYQRSGTEICVSCGKGHTWKVKPGNLLNGRGSWCRKCVHKGHTRNTRKKVLSTSNVEELPAAVMTESAVSIAQQAFSIASVGELQESEISEMQEAYGGLSEKPPVISTVGEWEESEIVELQKAVSTAGQATAPVEMNTLQQVKYNKMVEYCKSKGGTLVSPSYTGGKVEVHVKCNLGHDWWVQSRYILLNSDSSWCSHCSRMPRVEYYAAQEAVRAAGGIAVQTMKKSQLTYFNRLKELCEKKGGELLSTFYIDAGTEVSVRCSEGHEWTAKPSALTSTKNPKWCEDCKEEKEPEPVTIARVQKVARSLGGRCLSTGDITGTTILDFECANRHTWPKEARAVLYFKIWCVACYNMRMLTIEMMQSIARERGGECLSTTFVDERTHLLWRCAKGHEWPSSPSSVKHHGSWCAKCNGSNNDIDTIREIAAERGGVCLDDVYVNTTTKMHFKCAKDHLLEMDTHSLISHETWCRKCYHEGRKVTIDDLNEYARKFNGECTSKGEVELYKPVEWKCEKGHPWKGVPAKMIYAGRWCPSCQASSGELACANALKELNIHFTPQARFQEIPLLSFDFVFEYNGRKYVLEFDGKQHFKRSDFFHPKEGDFPRKRLVDVTKTKFAIKLGYCVIRIDYRNMRNIKDLLRKFLASDEKFQCTDPQLYEWIISEL